MSALTLGFSGDPVQYGHIGYGYEERVTTVTIVFSEAIKNALTKDDFTLSNAQIVGIEQNDALEIFRVQVMALQYGAATMALGPQSAPRSASTDEPLDRDYSFVFTWSEAQTAEQPFISSWITNNSGILHGQASGDQEVELHITFSHHVPDFHHDANFGYLELSPNAVVSRTSTYGAGDGYRFMRIWVRPTAPGLVTAKIVGPLFYEQDGFEWTYQPIQAGVIMSSPDVEFGQVAVSDPITVQIELTEPLYYSLTADHIVVNNGQLTEIVETDGGLKYLLKVSPQDPGFVHVEIIHSNELRNETFFRWRHQAGSRVKLVAGDGIPSGSVYRYELLQFDMTFDFPVPNLDKDVILLSGDATIPSVLADTSAKYGLVPGSRYTFIGSLPEGGTGKILLFSDRFVEEVEFEWSREAAPASGSGSTLSEGDQTEGVEPEDDGGDPSQPGGTVDPAQTEHEEAIGHYMRDGELVYVEAGSRLARGGDYASSSPIFAVEHGASLTALVANVDDSAGDLSAQITLDDVTLTDHVHWATIGTVANDDLEPKYFVIDYPVMAFRIHSTSTMKEYSLRILMGLNA